MLSSDSAGPPNGDSLHQPAEAILSGRIPWQRSRSHVRHRVLALKVDIQWSDPKSKALYDRLRDLSWQEARYRNANIRRVWAEAMGWRVDPALGDKTDITKQGRKTEKEELSGRAYAEAEREVHTIWKRDRNRILAGQPLPEWKPTTCLSVQGNKKKKASGVRLELVNDQYILHLQAQADTCADGSWLFLPIAKHTRRDEYQGEVLRGFVSWTIPILKATVEIKPHGIIVRLTYETSAVLPPVGERVASLTAGSEGRLFLRTELQTKDYTSKLAEIHRKKDGWDGIRRRVMAQVGRRHGHARIKREQLARMSTDQWMHSYIHEWTRGIVTWLTGQGVGTLNVGDLGNGDWPAWKFIQQLKYKAEDAGMVVVEATDIADESGARAARAEMGKRKKDTQKRRQALRELNHQLEKPKKEN